MSGPLPAASRVRRNAPTIATTVLPAAGRPGPPPAVPASYELGVDGEAFWRWSWALPQATRWDVGSHYTVARRASLEDDLAALEEFEGLNLRHLLGIAKDTGLLEAVRALEAIMRRLKALAGGKVSLMREMRELDKRLGLDPKAMAEMRWSIAKDDEPSSGDPGDASPKPKATGSRARKKFADPGAAAATG